MTASRVISLRINTRALLFGKCPYCGKRHKAPWGYWFRVYAYLAGWTR
jgi:hypothetical protein